MIRDMSITEQCQEVHRRMVLKGFWDHAITMIEVDPLISALSKRKGGIEVVNPSIFPEKLMLIVTEIGEMMEAFRDSPDATSVQEAEEAADVLIRLMDYCGARDIDLGEEYIKKMAKNDERPFLHGRKR